MIVYKDIQEHNDIPFDQYLKMPGLSQSYLKREVNGVAPGVEVSDAMRLGSMVDAILTEPEKVDYKSDLYEAGRSIASEINKSFGSYINAFKKQVNYTAIMSYEGFEMPVKGRLDFLIPKHIVLDLKVTASPLKAVPTLIKYMGYDNQLWNYGGLSQVKKAIIMAYSRKDKKTGLFQVPIDYNPNLFWAEKTTKFGTISPSGILK